MNFKILIGTWAFSMPSNEKMLQMERSKTSDFVSFQKCIHIIFIFTWKTSLSPKFNFPSKCKIQPLIFVDENKDHIPMNMEN